VEPAVDGAFELLDLMILNDADSYKRKKRNNRDDEIPSDTPPAALFVCSAR
jgi:hypothetical protein